MANELQHRHTATGSTIYGIVRDAITGQVVVQADGSLETQVNANWGTYDIPLTETPAAGYFYAGDMPAAVAGTYVGTVYLQAGGSPALTDTIIGEWEPFTWDGTAVVTGLALPPNGLDAIVVEAGMNARQALSIISAGVAGVLAGAATTSITIAAAGVPATNRITASVDSHGNRSVVTLSLPV